MISIKCLICGADMQGTPGRLGFVPQKYCDQCRSLSNKVHEVRSRSRRSILMHTKRIKRALAIIKEYQQRVNIMEDHLACVKYYFINGKFPWGIDETIEQKFDRELKQKKQDEKKQ